MVLFQQTSYQIIAEMKKISLATHEQIQKHSANNSPSKASFKFSKTKRFKDSNPECPIAYYTFQSQLSKRKTSIGSGKKSDFTKDLAKAPGSSQYNTNTYHEFIKPKGITFGSSREKSKDRSYLIPQIHIHPGPATYDNEKTKINNSSYTIRSKTIDVVDRRLTYRINPGPGAYQAVSLTPTSKSTTVSKFKAPQLCVGLTSKRFSQIKDAPGPQTYKQTDDFSAVGRYIVSQHQGKGRRPFTQQKRFKHQYWSIPQNPAPTDYDKPSDFGTYGSSTLYKGVSTAM